MACASIPSEHTEKKYIDVNTKVNCTTIADQLKGRSFGETTASLLVWKSVCGPKRPTPCSNCAIKKAYIKFVSNPPYRDQGPT